MLENLFNNNRFVSNTNLLFKNAKLALMDKKIIKKGNEIFIYEIDSLKRHGEIIKIIEINKLPITYKTKKRIKYGKVPTPKEILKDFK
jgi:alcohol dehydrogenase YqhD (iron-dependent ADH family)